MTVIAVNKEMIAADSLYIAGDLNSYGQKTYNVNNDLIGFSGYEQDGLLFVEWYKNGRDIKEKPELDECFCALMLIENKIYVAADKCVITPIHEKFYAIGVGKYTAIGAMAAGKNPIDAVKIACLYVCGCGLPAQHIKIDETKIMECTKTESRSERQHV